MNKLDYSISLRKKGVATSEIKKLLKEQGLEESQIQYYLKKSDEIFLNQLTDTKKSNSNVQSKSAIKIAILVFNFFLLYNVFFGYARYTSH